MQHELQRTGSAMAQPGDAVLKVVAEQIRRTVNEDWIMDVEIGRATRFDSDLELESIEFIKIIGAIQGCYGSELGIIAWLGGKSVQELIGFSVGDLVDFIASTNAPLKV